MSPRENNPDLNRLTPRSSADSRRKVEASMPARNGVKLMRCGLKFYCVDQNDQPVTGERNGRDRH